MIIKEFPFYTAATRLQDFYGIVLTDDEFENMAISA
jgi:hypothetical protein